jgi:hypothetical protein
MTDRERILSAVVSELATTQLLCRGGYSEQDFKGRGLGDTDAPYVHFAYYREPVAGDLVLAKTGHNSEWKIGWYVRRLDAALGGAVIREIGSERLCNYSNEGFVPIVGMYKSEILEGLQYKISRLVQMAFKKGDEYSYRFAGVEFVEGNKAIIWVREVWGGLSKPSKPFSIELIYDKKTTIKKILEVLRAGGYGTRKFELVNPDPSPNLIQ